MPSPALVPLLTRSGGRQIFEEKPNIASVWKPGAGPVDTLKQPGHVLTEYKVILYGIGRALVVTARRDWQYFQCMEEI